MIRGSILFFVMHVCKSVTHWIFVTTSYMYITEIVNTTFIIAKSLFLEEEVGK